MDEEKRRRLEARGWKVGTVAEFLKLTPEQAAAIERRLAEVAPTIAAIRGARHRISARFGRRNCRLLRPSSERQFRFAPMTEIARYDQLAADFFDKILHMNYDECLVSDWSSLWDFPFEESEVFYRKIEDLYGVDVSDIESGYFVQIFQRITERG